MIRLHTWATPNGRKVSIALEELGLAYEARPIDIGKDEQFHPRFLELNPNNKIPVIEDSNGPDGRSLVLFESGAILIYLAEKTGRLLPLEPHARYRTFQWLMFQMGAVGPMFGQTHHFRRHAPNEKYGLERYTKETHRLYRVLDGVLAKSAYIAGADYSIADIATYPWIARFELHDLRWGEVPHVKRWFDSVGSRPAVQRGMKVPG
jgi:GSH-dependent disulfide-bond oxidoreductase